MTTKVQPQSFLFPKSEWTKREALSWLRSHGRVYAKVDDKAAHYRFRQFSPKRCRSYGTKVWKSSGRAIKVVFCLRKVR